MSRVVKADQIRVMRAYELDMIPINPWNRVDTDKETGKEIVRGKTPRDSNWLRVNYSMKQLENWVTRGGNLGVRIAPNMVVIDIDPRHADARGRTADEIVDDLELEFGDLRTGLVVRTGGGGLHIYLVKSAHVKVRNAVEAFGGCVEFKSWGRQVLAAGSKHPSGAYYELLSENAPKLIDDGLLAAIRKPEVKPRESRPGEGASIERVQAAFDQLDPADFRDYDKWRNLLFSTHYATCGSPDGLRVFKAWSARDPEYADGSSTIDLFWHYATDERPDGITEATLFYEVDRTGGLIPEDAEAMRAALGPVDPPKGDPADGTEEERELPPAVYRRDRKGFIDHRFAENLAASMRQLGIGVRTDEFTGRRWLVDRGGFMRKHFGLADGQELTDRGTLLIGLAVTREIRYWTGEPSKDNTYRAIAVVDHVFHSLRAYLDELEWDGVPRLDSWLIQGSELADTPYTRAVSRLWLYAAVGRAYTPGIKFDAMIVLEGPQGGGKSSLIRWLGGQWAAEGLPEFRSSADKDVVAGMLGRWLVEIEELSAMKKADVEVLKAFLSKQEDRVRPPYGREVVTYPRQCIFIGTTNRNEYLRDMTGNRRYLPLDIGRVRFDQLAPRDQLWAEAVAVWKAAPVTEVIGLPSTFWGVAADEQEARRMSDAWEEPLAMFLEKLAASEVTTSLIFEECFHRVPRDASPSDCSRVASIMAKLGWERTNKIRSGNGFVRGYRKANAEME